MEAASPARLYATAVGALLVVLGIVGFFYGASFGSPGAVEEALGVLRVNGWLNLLHVVTGSIGLLAADHASRPYATGIGLLYVVLAIWGFALGGGDAILGILPSNGGNDALHLILGVLGLLAAAGTPRGSSSASEARRERRDRSEARAQPAGDRP